MTEKNFISQKDSFGNVGEKGMAEHNGVDTSKWGNNCHRIAVSETWQDHQHTQQLVRLYLNNDNTFIAINRRIAVIFVKKSDYDTIFSFAQYPVSDRYVTARCLNMTCLGMCLDVHVARDFSDIDSDIVYGDMCKKVNPFITGVKIVPTTDDLQKVFLDGEVFSRKDVEEWALHAEYATSSSLIGMKSEIKRQKE